MTTIGVAPDPARQRGLRVPRRMVLAVVVILGIVLLVAPLLVEMLEGRAMRAHIGSYGEARQSLSLVMTDSAALHGLASGAGAAPEALDRAQRDLQASLRRFAAATSVEELREAGGAFVAAARADAELVAQRARAGRPVTSPGALGMDALLEQSLRVAQAIDAAQDAWVARDNGFGRTAALLQSLASVGLLGLVAREIGRRHRLDEARTRRLAHIAESVADAVIVRDAEGRITEWNDRAAALYGYTRAEALGRANFPRPLGEELPFEDVLATLHAGGEVLARRVVRVHRDGTPMHVDISAFLILDDEGRPAGTCSLNVDVTAVVRAAEALRRSEAYLRSVLDSSAMGIGAAVVDAQGAIAFANAQFERLAPEALGLSGAPVIGARVDGAVEADVPGVAAWLTTVRAGLAGNASSAEFPLAQGRWARVDGAPVWDEVGLQAGVILVVRDVTRARVDEERARVAEGRAAAIFHAAPVGLLVLDDHGRIEEVNAAASEITGYPASALVGQPAAMLADVSETTHRELLREALEHIDLPDVGRGAAVAHPDRFELRRSDGRSFPAGLQIGVLNMGAHASGQNELKFLCAITDISPQVSAEREARRVERTQALNTLVGGVAHDFNNLLTVISGGIEIARTSEGDMSEWLDRSAAAATQAAGLVRQLLRYSRPERDALEPVRLDEAVHETVSLVRATFDRRLTIHLEGAGAETVVQGNRSQLEQVIMNLLVNARDAVLARLEEDAEGSPAALGAYAPRITVSLRRDTVDVTRAVLRVRDNGVGIPASVIDQVFDPFFTTKGPERGTGLGLATVSSIVRAHGGQVTVDSEAGVGTAFNVYLPLESLRPAAVASTAGLEGRVHRGNVLVVDDEEPVARIAQRALTAVGMDVTIALDGRAAVRECHSQLFDVILLDLNMPRPDGAETLVRLRAAAPRTPVIVVSGRLGAGEIAAAAGVEFLAKPYVHTELVRRVSAIIEAHTAA